MPPQTNVPVHHTEFLNKSKESQEFRLILHQKLLLMVAQQSPLTLKSSEVDFLGAYYCGCGAVDAEAWFQAGRFEHCKKKGSQFQRLKRSYRLTPIILRRFHIVFLEIRIDYSGQKDENKQKATVAKSFKNFMAISFERDCGLLHRFRTVLGTGRKIDQQSNCLVNTARMTIETATSAG